MNRRLLFLLTSPALLLGSGLIGSCAVGLWAINHLQTQLIGGFHYNVASLRSALEMEVALRQLRFDSLLQIMEPTEGRRQRIEQDHRTFEAALERAKMLGPPEQGRLIGKIEEGYRRYRKELDEATATPRPETGSQTVKWADSHPILFAVTPCRELLDANQEMMESSLKESEAFSGKLQIFLLLLGAIGPVGGVLCGYGVAWGLSRSIARLQVHVQDVHSQLAPETELVEVKLGRGLDSLHDQLQFVVQRVRGLVEHMQAQQRALARSEQMVLVGQLASSFAHEVRNPLTAMKWLIDDAVQGYPEESLRLEDLRVLQSEIGRLERTVQGVLDFARPAKPRRQECDLRDLVQQAMELIRARKRQLGVACQLDLPDAPVRAFIDPAQLNSVLVNLLLNALDAMSRASPPRLEGMDIQLLGDYYRDTQTRSGQLRVSLKRVPGGRVHLLVEDSGPGIAPEILGRLFTPFVTSKPTGTGLGLTVARQIVEEHGGQLTAENRAEGGARFIVSLPVEIEAREKP